MSTVPSPLGDGLKSPLSRTEPAQFSHLSGVLLLVFDVAPLPLPSSFALPSRSSADGGGGGST